jgi:hypothetical protein
MKSENTDIVNLDVEQNPLQKFWAGPGYRVKMWFLADKPALNQNNAPMRVDDFLTWIMKNKLGRVTKSPLIPGSYAGEVYGAVLHPDFKKIYLRLPRVLKEANSELEARWKKIEPHMKGVKLNTDKVAMKW